MSGDATMSENISDMELAASKDIISFWLDAKAMEHEKDHYKG
jgi:hypothetical protein